jgi:hypothetical protein
MMRAVLSFEVGACDVDLSWLDDLQPADAATLHCTIIVAYHSTTARVLVAGVFEQQGRHADAIRFAQTDLQNYHNLNVPSKVRVTRVLGGREGLRVAAGVLRLSAATGSAWV